MLRQSAPRLLLGLITMFATLVDPIASVVHGVAHAAASAQDRESIATLGVQHDEAGAHEHDAAGIAVEAPEHHGAHETLHRAAMRDASTPSSRDAMPSPHASGLASQPSIIAHAALAQSDGQPPDFGLGSRDLARAPPLA